MAPLVSVIVPVYNVSPYLRQCMDSIVNQTLKDIEIICVDDGSTDNSLNILKEYAKKDHRIRITQQKNAGGGAARNSGMKIANGKYLSFLDSDDFFEPELLETLFDSANKQDADISICCSDQYIKQKYYPLNATSDWLIPTTQPFSGMEIKDIFRAFIFWPWDKLFKKEFILQNELSFQELKSTNDLFFVCAAIIMAKKIIVTSTKPLVHYRRYQSRSSSSISTSWNKSWGDYHCALIKLKSYIIEKELYDKLAINFINYALCFSLVHLEGTSGDAFKLHYNRLRDSWFEELGIDTLSKKSVYSRAAYYKYMYIRKTNFNEYYSKKILFHINPKYISYLICDNIRSLVTGKKDYLIFLIYAAINKIKGY